MLAFIGSNLLSSSGPAIAPHVSVPRSGAGPVTFDHASLGGATIGRPSMGAGTAAQESAAAAGQALIAVVAICGLLGTARRRRGQPRSRVALGPSGGTWYQYRFRAKPGDKFKYRYSTDWDMPEFGELPEARNRCIKYGYLLRKGTPGGEARYHEQQDRREAQQAARAKAVEGALLVDCDGTIVETERDGHRVAFNKAFKEKGYDCEWEVELYGELLTTGGGKERMTRYFKDYNPEAWPHEDPPAKDHPAIVELHALKTELFMEIVRSGQLPLRPGIEQLLTEADTMGWSIAVCSTSNEESVKAVVETLLPELAPSITIFAGDCVKAKKPDPEIYKLASKKLKVAPMKCVVVEDTNIGMAAGKAAGMQVIVTKSIYSEDEDFADADLVVSSASEVDFTTDVKAMLPTLELA